MEYKNIEGFKGVYKISNTGIVLALDRKVKMPNGGFKVIKQHYPKLSVTYRGYLKVMLTDGNSRKGFFVHRLVGNAFIKNKNSSNLQINHKDKNKQNNKVENLEWVTNQQNSIHRVDKTKTHSKYYGVTKNKNSWQAQKTVKGKAIYLGSFKTQEEANIAVKTYRV